MNEEIKNRMLTFMESEMSGHYRLEQITALTEVIEEAGKETNLCTLSFNKTELLALQKALCSALTNPDEGRFDLPTTDKSIDRWIVKVRLKHISNILAAIEESEPR